jgi:hypothetical protein
VEPTLRRVLEVVLDAVGSGAAPGAKLSPVAVEPAKGLEP